MYTIPSDPLLTLPKIKDPVIYLSTNSICESHHSFHISSCYDYVSKETIVFEKVIWYYSFSNFCTIASKLAVEPNETSRKIPFLSTKIVDGVPCNEYISNVSAEYSFDL